MGWLQLRVASTPLIGNIIEVEIQILFYLKSKEGFIMKIFIISLLLVVRHLFRLSLIASFLIFFSFFNASIVFPSDLIPVRTPSTGYQPQFQVLGNKIYYIWHEYDCFYRLIFTAEMNTDGTGWIENQRTIPSFDKYTHPIIGSSRENLLCLGRIRWKTLSDLDGCNE